MAWNQIPLKPSVDREPGCISCKGYRLLGVGEQYHGGFRPDCRGAEARATLPDIDSLVPDLALGLEAVRGELDQEHAGFGIIGKIAVEREVMRNRQHGVCDRKYVTGLEACVALLTTTSGSIPVMAVEITENQDVKQSRSLMLKTASFA